MECAVELHDERAGVFLQKWRKSAEVKDEISLDTVSLVQITHVQLSRHCGFSPENFDRQRATSASPLAKRNPCSMQLGYLN